MRTRSAKNLLLGLPGWEVPNPVQGLGLWCPHPHSTWGPQAWNGERGALPHSPGISLLPSQLMSSPAC